jgi:hypothetical protein
MVVLGQFAGGAFRYNDQFLDLKDKVICFDGSLEHASEPFEGHRVSIIWFLHSSAAHPSPMELDSLVALGLMDSTAVVPERIVEDHWDLLYKLPRNVLADKQAVRSAAALGSKLQNIHTSQRVAHRERKVVSTTVVLRAFPAGHAALSVQQGPSGHRDGRSCSNGMRHGTPQGVLLHT